MKAARTGTESRNELIINIYILDNGVRRGIT